MAGKTTKTAKVSKSAKTPPAAPAKAAQAEAPRKSWQARIGGATDALAIHFVESLSFDFRLARHDITGSIAHATMLKSVGLISGEEFDQIAEGLVNIHEEIRAGNFKIDLEQEDIHMAIEAALIARIGEPGRKLHTARSRNDQVALDIRLWAREAIELLEAKISDLQQAFVTMAATQGNIPMPSFTHLQRAQPILAGHELLAYVEMLERDKERLGDLFHRVNICPLGAGAVGGTTLPIDRDFTAKLLGMSGVTDNSLDSISDRDSVIELSFCLSMIAMHLSRWAEQWILYVSTEFGFVRIADQYTTGSSMMPQKRNPDMLELIRGKTGGVYGQLVALLTMLKGQPLAYNRDMQEDKRYLFAAYDAVEASLAIAAGMVANSQLVGERISARLEEGFLDATALAEYLVRKGIPFRTAHHVVGTLVAQAEARGLKALNQLTLPEMQAESPAIEKDVLEILGASKVIEAYVSHGSGGRRGLAAQLKKWKKLGLAPQE